jgi:hypothetical protein
MSEKQYADRDAWAMDKAGGYYMRHVQAMTAENLHGKGDIAAELAYRDMRIARLEDAIRWACGEVGEFPGEDPARGRYFWRKELRSRAGVTFTAPSDAGGELTKGEG